MDANDGSNGSMVVMDSAPHSIFHTLLHDLKVNYRRLYSQFFALAAWLASYEQAAVIVPYAMMAPYLFAVDPAQRTTLGSLVKLSNAFNKVFDSVNIVSDNFLEINEWRSVLVRLREFEREMFHPEHTAGSKKFPGQHGFMQPIPTDEYEGAASPRLARTPRPSGGAARRSVAVWAAADTRSRGSSSSHGDATDPSHACYSPCGAMSRADLWHAAAGRLARPLHTVHVQLYTLVSPQREDRQGLHP